MDLSYGRNTEPFRVYRKSTLNHRVVTHRAAIPSDLIFYRFSNSTINRKLQCGETPLRWESASGSVLYGNSGMCLRQILVRYLPGSDLLQFVFSSNQLLKRAPFHIV